MSLSLSLQRGKYFNYIYNLISNLSHTEFRKLISVTLSISPSWFEELLPVKKFSLLRRNIHIISKLDQNTKKFEKLKKKNGV